MKKRVIATYTRFNVICENGHVILRDYDIEEYPYSWQYIECPKCHFRATPDLDHPIEHKIYTIFESEVDVET